MNPTDSHYSGRISVPRIAKACMVVLVVNGAIVWMPLFMLPDSLQLQVADILNRCMLAIGVSSFVAFLVGLHQDNRMIVGLGIVVLIGWAFAIATTYGCWPFG